MAGYFEWVVRGGDEACSWEEMDVWIYKMQRYMYVQPPRQVTVDKKAVGRQTGSGSCLRAPWCRCRREGPSQEGESVFIGMGVHQAPR